MTKSPSNITLIAQAIGSQRAALLAYGDDLTFEQAAEINETSGFTIERQGSMDSRLVIEGLHLTEAELHLVYRRSEEFLGA